MQLSVVIPTCNRNESLALCLERLAPGCQQGEVTLIPAADADADADATATAAAADADAAGSAGHGSYEVIVTDAAVAGIAEALLRERFPWARWSPAPRHGPGPNRNAGVKSARGEWLAFVDDDCLPDPNWISRLVARIATGECDVVEGAVLSPDLPDHPLWAAPVNTTGNAGWTANLCVRRVVFEKLGGFDPDLPETAEDMEFHSRSKHAGYRWVFAADAIVVHPPRHLTWAQLWRDTLRFRWWFMYRLKVGWGPGPDANALTSAWDVVRSLIYLYAQMTWHLVRDVARGRRRLGRRDVFLRLRDWLLLPVLAPYFWRWSVVYRRQLRARPRT